MPHSADDWIRRLNLQPHPEGGHFAEVYRSGDLLPAEILGGRYGGRRCCATSIHFLLRSGEISAFHRLRSDEIWYHQAGAGVHIVRLEPGGARVDLHLGPDPGQALQAVVPAGDWFGARVDEPDSYALVGCCVAPGFSYEDFELGRRGTLLATHPQHRAIIEQMTRG